MKVKTLPEETYGQQYLQGQVWFVKADSNASEYNHLQDKTRPCVIISANKGNARQGFLTVLPLSSKEKKELPFNVLIRNPETNQMNTVLCNQIRSVPYEDIKPHSYMWTISQAEMNMIEKALGYSLNLEIADGKEKFSINQVEKLIDTMINTKLKQRSETDHFVRTLLDTLNYSIKKAEEEFYIAKKENDESTDDIVRKENSANLVYSNKSASTNVAPTKKKRKYTKRAIPSNSYFKDEKVKVLENMSDSEVIQVICRGTKDSRFTKKYKPSDDIKLTILVDLTDLGFKEFAKKYDLEWTDELKRRLPYLKSTYKKELNI